MKPLRNINASCFINTVLQSLFTCGHFNDHVLLAIGQNKQKTLDDPVIGSYCLLSKSLIHDNITNVEAFVNAVRQYDQRWNGMCDSFEFLECVIDRLEKLIHINIIEIKQKKFFTLSCGHVGVIDNQESSEHFLYIQQLQQTNNTESYEYKCSVCSQYVTATAITQIIKLPLLLIVAVSNKVDQILTQIQLQDSESNKSYELKAMYLYSGIGNIGHYVAIVKNQDQWFLCDDQNIKPISNISASMINLIKCFIYEQIV